MKKLIALLLAVVLLSITAVSVAEKIIGGPGPMFVYTENGKGLNDLSEEEMNTLKASFTDLNEVAFSETVTAAGTKLLIARETGSDEDFVSIITLYKGYSVEFLLAPNQDAAHPVLTDAQVQTAIDFLSNLNFIPAN